MNESGFGHHVVVAAKNTLETATLFNKLPISLPLCRFWWSSLTKLVRVWQTKREAVLAEIVLIGLVSADRSI